MKRVLIAAFMMLAPVSALVAQEQTDEQRRAAVEARRDSLEGEVVERFVVRLGRELSLTEAQRVQTQRILVASGRDRRQLATETYALRGRITRGLRVAETTDAEFATMLAQFEALQMREQELARRDQEQLAAVMSPRQRAHFLIVWRKFQDDMRDILRRRMRDEPNRGSRDRRRDNDGARSERARSDTIPHRHPPAS